MKLYGKEVLVMIAGKPNRDKQLLAEKFWLLYFNDALYRDGIITKEDYHKMIHQINSRASVIDKQPDAHRARN